MVCLARRLDRRRSAVHRMLRLGATKDGAHRQFWQPMNSRKKIKLESRARGVCAVIPLMA